MTYAIIFIAVLAICIFNNYNERIRRLEREITELNRKINEGSLRKHPGIAEETVDSPGQTEEHTNPAFPVSEMLKDKSQRKQGKDRLAPVFEFLKQNALTIVGIFTLVLGIGYFVKYAIDKNWIGETPRVGIGFLAGAFAKSW